MSKTTVPAYWSGSSAVIFRRLEFSSETIENRSGRFQFLVASTCARRELASQFLTYRGTVESLFDDSGQRPISAVAPFLKVLPNCSNVITTRAN